MHQETARRHWPGSLDRSRAARNDQDWYANLLWCEGRPGLLLTHAGTLFAIFEADVGAAELRATGSIVSSLFRRERINQIDVVGEVDPATEFSANSVNVVFRQELRDIVSSLRPPNLDLMSHRISKRCRIVLQKAKCPMVSSTLHRDGLNRVSTPSTFLRAARPFTQVGPWHHVARRNCHRR